MSDNKKYYYMRLKDNFFDTDEMLLLASMPNGPLYQTILLRLYLRSLKDEGLLMFRGTIPYTPQVLAQILNVEVGTMKEALRLFKELKLIDVLDTGEIYMLDIQQLVGRSSTEADRQRKYQRAIAQNKDNGDVRNLTKNVRNLTQGVRNLTNTPEHENNVNVDTPANNDVDSLEGVRNLTKEREKSTPEIEIEIEKELEIETDEQRSDEFVDNSSNRGLNKSNLSVIINNSISDNGLDFIYGTNQRQQLIEYVTHDGLGVEVVTNAIQLTKEANKPAFKYTDAILKKRLTQGLTTIEAVQAHEQARANANGTSKANANEPDYKSHEWFNQQTPESVLSYFDKN